MKGKEKNFSIGKKVVNDAGSLESIEHRHGNIHDNDFGLQRLRKLDGFLTILGLATKLPFGEGAENPLNAAANHGMIIYDQDTGHKPSQEIRREGVPSKVSSEHRPH